MARTSPRTASIGLLSTYPPTQCGLATFTAALGAELADAGVVRVVERPESHPGEEVVAHLVNGSRSQLARAVRHLDAFDVTIVQHEYGIFGGPDGADVVDLVEALSGPVIIVFHTVLENPTPNQRRVLRRLVVAADVAVTMTEAARRRLVDGYAAVPSRTTVIPHGAVEHPVSGRRAPTTGRPVILTWGLLGPGKGLEWAIEALPGLRDLEPRYLVIGKTHPKVLERHGEEYRQSLVRRIAELGVGDLVELDDSYLDVPELAALVRSADVVLLPYDSRDQVTSGVLTEAVAAGRPVVSTAFPHAVELLTDGPGLVVPQQDAAAIEVALRRVLTEPGLSDLLEDRAARAAPELFWSAVAARYQRIADGLVAATLVAAS